MSQLSYARGVEHPPLLEYTIGEALERAAAAWGDQLALVSRHQGIRWTWAELNAEVDRIATGLLHEGVVKGDRVGIWAPNCAEWTVIQFATARIGAVLVTIKKLDDNIGLAGEPKANLIGLMRDLYPQHKDKTDEELLRLVGGMGQ